MNVEMLMDMRERLGPTLVRVLLNDEVGDERLKLADEAWQTVSIAEGEDLTRAWFIGANPRLGDISPVEAIREGLFAEVRSAAIAAADGNDW